MFTDEDGREYRERGVTASRRHRVLQHRIVARAVRRRLLYYVWNGNDDAALTEIESKTVSFDQLMRFEMDGMTGMGIFELLVGGDRYPRYPAWGFRSLDAGAELRQTLGGALHRAHAVLERGRRVQLEHPARLLVDQHVTSREVARLTRRDDLVGDVAVGPPAADASSNT